MKRVIRIMGTRALYVPTKKAGVGLRCCASIIQSVEELRNELL